MLVVATGLLLITIQILTRRSLSWLVSANALVLALMLYACSFVEGVSPNNRSRVFESFFTTRRDRGGTGMGLAIVRAMLTAHGGWIDLEDAGRGAHFVVQVPLSQN